MKRDPRPMIDDNVVLAAKTLEDQSKGHKK